MKILSIELQNINSLKSETPIKIDFESDAFKNVGLYAITGATGAGKTTLLDAITIALYNQVPRFNHTNAKGLENVVSFGAKDAFSRVVFENNRNRYEAYWGISLVTANGKTRTTPKEIVLLKNLSEEKIIAEKKRELKIEIEEITALNYEQFLRSVLLAQGEFAAFLSAKGTEKAKLLEQITGEVIYKRIGETTQRRKAEETRKLDDLKLTIDDKNLLSEEQIKEKKEALKDVELQLKEISKDAEKYQKIKAWYIQSHEIQKDKADIVLKQEQFANYKLKHAANMELLAQDEKAIPFKELITLLEKDKKDITVQKETEKLNQNKVKDVAASLLLLQKEITETEKLKTTAEKNDIEWEPKLELVTRIDTELQGISVDLRKKHINHQETKEKNDSLIKEINLLKTEIKTNKIQINPLETYLKENESIPQKETHYLDWNTTLASIKTYQKQYSEFNASKNKLEESITSLSLEKKKTEENHNTSDTKYKQHKLLSENIETFLKKNDLEKLLIQKDKQETLLKGWLDFQRLSVDYINKKKEVLSLENESISFQKKEVLLNNKITELEKQETLTKQGVLDAETILKQEQLILNFSEERKKLVQGKSCNVCGSKEHPFVEVYKEIKVSDSEKELELRKNTFQKITKELQVFKVELATIKTNISNTLKKLDLLKIDLKKLEALKTESKLIIEFEESEKIIVQITTIETELTILNKTIKEIQEKTREKENIDKETRQLLEHTNLLKQQLVKVDTNEKSRNAELTDLNKSLLKTKNDIETLTSNLQLEFNKMGIKVSETETLENILSQLGNSIKQYKTNKEIYQKLTEKLKGYEIQLSNDEKNLKSIGDILLKQSKEIEDLNSTTIDKQQKRSVILPKEITVVFKRQTLKNEVIKWRKETASLEHKLQIIKESSVALSTKIIEIKKNIIRLQTSYETTEKELTSKIEFSNFQNKEEIVKSLLVEEDRVRFREILKKIEQATQTIKALLSKNKEKTEIALKKKDFEILEEEVLQKLKEMNALQTTLSQTEGKIKEQFVFNQQIISNNKEVVTKIKNQEKEVIKWSSLLTVLGGSKDAFNIYVQRLTLKNLIDLANMHLYKLNKRYSLKLDTVYTKGEELAFKLTDHFQANQTRYVDTSSGGEKFLISLALALGLSDLASNNVKIDSLFIDEGFGTLDLNTLETVVSTLENLQSQGKMIGVISHVESLKERIGTQIQLVKKGEGISEVLIVS